MASREYDTSLEDMVIDLEVAKCFRESSFVSLPDPCSKLLRRKCLVQWKKFFENKAEKRVFENDGKDLSGYFGWNCERAIDAQIADSKEFFHYYGQRSKLPAMCSASDVLFSRITHVANLIISELAREFDRLRGLKLMCEGSHLLRAVHYRADHAQTLAHAHTDITLFTVFCGSDVSGLVLETPGKERRITPDGFDCLDIFAGDMLEIATNGAVRAVKHAVRSEGTSNDRHSIIFFANPPNDFRLSASWTAGEALSQRLDDMRAHDN